jgi:(E)-4-hydroxy-3-methylbut-2-enyl-diphosphate synthase
MDTEATIAQSIRMIEAGCEYVRITAPSINEAQNLANIKAGLRQRGYNTPLIADIHFTPNAAELAARIVEKVRINPGNYVDKKKFEVKEYTDADYEAELGRIRKRFEPLVKICKEYGTAMRIGTNHGSLSDRIMNRYGDSPMGMVESAMEFLRICEDLHYYNIVLSMKSSNPQVMIQAYRLLIASMNEEGMNYPLHLGVTEAGEAEEGRIKSAMGIGTLLEDGIGDTIRVSLTEEPEHEIPVARALVDRYHQRAEQSRVSQNISLPEEEFKNSPFAYKRRESFEVANLGGHNVPRVIVDLSHIDNVDPLHLKAVDMHYNAISDKWNTGEQASDYLYFGSLQPGFMLPNGTKGIYDHSTWLLLEDRTHNFPLVEWSDYSDVSDNKRSSTLNFVRLSTEEASEDTLLQLAEDKSAVIVLHTDAVHNMPMLRQVFFRMQRLEVKNPVIIQEVYKDIDKLHFLLESATDTGGLLNDGFGDGLFVNYSSSSSAEDVLKTAKLVNQTAFYILQASRTRISKTEYISCPSCGRTLFDLQDTTAMIRKKTDHLKGVKIAIMGCIVNGPGEMADADYGYVGTGPGKITLYRGKEVVKRNIQSGNALDELINLIKEDGHWIDNEIVA